jgi:hypothetical protein
MSELTIIGNTIDARPHRAQNELEHFLHYHPNITPLNNPKVAELQMRIENVFAADTAEPQPEPEDYTDR